LICRRRQILSGLPPGIGRAALHAPVYITFQPISRTALCIPAEAVGSYPAFSPLPALKSAVVFCYVALPSLTSSR